MEVVEAVVLDNGLGNDLGIGEEARVLVQYDELWNGTIIVSING
jgi:hypothetical protein